MARGILLVMGLASTLSVAAAADTADGARVAFKVLAEATDRPVPCRIHLKDAADKPQRAGTLPFWFDHFSCDGTADLALAPGKYTYEIERGPEYRPERGSFTLEPREDKKVVARLSRLADLAKEGWWSGELHIHRPPEEIELLARAEDLHVAPVITWWNKRNLWATKPIPDEPLRRFDRDRYAFLLAGEDEREGGALLYFGLPRPLEIASAAREYPSPLRFVAEARKHMGVWIDVEKPFWWDVPVWVASGQVDSIGLANNHMCRDRMSEKEAWGKPRLVERLPAPLGNGYWSQEIYYHLLNCGIRLPPSAGSASGVLPNPVGYNRVYVHLGPDWKYEDWWDGLRAGRSFVTNGPLLRVRADGQLPGHVFTAPTGKELRIELRAELTSSDPVRFVEIIRDGDVLRRVRTDDLKRTGGLGALDFNSSGWFLVRAIADNPKTFRFASTAPYYVEIGESKRRISRASARFFGEWVRERAARVKIDDPAERAEVLRHHESAQKFWEDVLSRANAE
jgi:hypothetical protein